MEDLSRIYEKNAPKNADRALAKVGRPPFRFILVEDTSPNYTWTRSVSKLIEPANADVISLKEEFRSWFPEKYQVHSSTNMRECLYQSVLILGVDNFKRALGGAKRVRMVLDKDLEGCHGWYDWSHFFSVMNRCVDYLVLYDFEGLPESLDADAITFLCDDLFRFKAAANLRRDKGRAERYSLIVGGKRFSVYVRVVGDGYFDTKWQIRMLSNRKFTGDLYIPTVEDHFFGLWYHALIHEGGIKRKRSKQLNGLAREMGLDWFKPQAMMDTLAACSILSGFMIPNGYSYAKPLDPAVKGNLKARLQLPSPSSVRAGLIGRRLLGKLSRFVLLSGREKTQVIVRMAKKILWSLWARRQEQQ
ncbi:hypothetical protein EQG41_04445 [Billgrantia azerbaijanica]|nr:hypothetical protein EQG41_04445 [Halomonas azerbaijanica]